MLCLARYDPFHSRYHLSFTVTPVSISARTRVCPDVSEAEYSLKAACLGMDLGSGVVLEQKDTL